MLYPYIQYATIAITAFFSICGIISLFQGNTANGLLIFLLSAPLCWILTSIKILEIQDKKSREEIRQLIDAGELFLPENCKE